MIYDAFARPFLLDEDEFRMRKVFAQSILPFRSVFHSRYFYACDFSSIMREFKFNAIAMRRLQIRCSRLYLNEVDTKTFLIVSHSMHIKQPETNSSVVQ